MSFKAEGELHMAKKNSIELSKNIKGRAIEDIKKYFYDEREETLGDLQAELILDFFMKNIAPHVYNMAIGDAYGYMNEKVEDLFGLEKRER